MQSSALHLPRCIDAIYESRNVLRAKILPHVFINNSGIRRDRGKQISIIAYNDSLHSRACRKMVFHFCIARMKEVKQHKYHFYPSLVKEAMMC